MDSRILRLGYSLVPAGIFCGLSAFLAFLMTLLPTEGARGGVIQGLEARIERAPTISRADEQLLEIAVKAQELIDGPLRSGQLVLQKRLEDELEMARITSQAEGESERFLRVGQTAIDLASLYRTESGLREVLRGTLSVSLQDAGGGDGPISIQDFESLLAGLNSVVAEMGYVAGLGIGEPYSREIRQGGEGLRSMQLKLRVIFDRVTDRRRLDEKLAPNLTRQIGDGRVVTSNEELNQLGEEILGQFWGTSQ
jgi:hypothetical protein